MHPTSNSPGANELGKVVSPQAYLPRSRGAGRSVYGSDRPNVRVMLVDGCATFRSGLRQALDSTRGVVVVCDCGEAAEAAGRCAGHPADVAVIDIDLPGQGGVELCRRLAYQRQTRVLMVGEWDWDVHLAVARAARADGYLLRRSPTAELVRNIREARMRPLFSPEQLERAAAWSETIGRLLASLSQRQWDTLWLVAEGKSNRDIARHMSISENTVEKHIGEVLRKLGAPSRSGLLALVLQHHLEVLNRPGQRRSAGAPAWWTDLGAPKHDDLDLRLAEAAAP